MRSNERNWDIGDRVDYIPDHPFTIEGYIFGAIALLTTAAQIFKWNTQIINDHKIALLLLLVALS